MSKGINLLSARAVTSLKVAGRHSDGGGLYLRVSSQGGKSWVFMTSSGGRRVEIGLGSASAVGLADARKLAAEMRRAVALGEDPRALLTREAISATARAPTFGKFSEEFISSIEAGWKNRVHRQQWRNSLRDHAALLTPKVIDEITTDDLLAVLQPIWLTKSETAGRVRGRIERILNAAKAKGLLSRDASNPARLKGHLDLLLPKRPTLTRGHHAALPFEMAPDFMTALRAREAETAKCLEFTVLTAARSGEALGATWGEIDVDAKLWRVPAKRMKSGVEHVVPLSESALALVKLKPGSAQSSDLIFHIGGASRSNMAMSMLLRRMGFGHVTTHGFRSTFRDWAGDATTHAREIIEAALAHTIQNKAERAYRRGTAIERRRTLMNEWDIYLSGRCD